MTLSKLPLLMAAIAIPFVAWFAVGCAGGSAAPRDFVQPTAPSPVTVVPTPAVTDSAYRPDSSSDIAALTGVPEVCPEHGYCARLEPGGRLTAAAWLDEDRMYLADFEGRIRLLDVRTGVVTMVLEGLSIPRGLTVLDGRLYVSEMGNVCRLVRQVLGEAGIRCKYEAGASDLEFLSRTSAQVLSYQIDGSGGLIDRQVIVDRIMAWDPTHAPNGLANDGEYVYVSIGHPQHVIDPGHILITHADELKSHNRRTDLMGVVARFRPPDNEVEVYATGLRNTYGISIAPDGTIYGADNDGPPTEGQREELNAIVAGGFYGYPIYGTHEAPPAADVSEPVAVLEGKASTFAHANPDGIYVAYLALDDSNDGFVVDRFDYAGGTPERIVSARGYTTAILERNGLLYLASFDGIVHVINPRAIAAAPLNLGSYYDDYVDEVIADGGRPIIASDYDVYLGAGVLIYDKHPCTPADTEVRFFLHIVPVNPDVLPENRRQYNFDGRDFDFAAYGWRNGDRCRAVRRLPEYDISTIRTGQSVREESGWRSIWEGQYHLNFGSYYDDYLDEVIADGGLPIIASDYDVYLGAGVLIYDKYPCTPSDTGAGFFLHVVPANRDDLPENRQQNAFDNLDFSFDDYGWRNGDRCRAVRRLPEYDISTIRTGQSVHEESGWRSIWEGEYRFGR